LKSKEKTTLKVLANELAAVRIAMIKSERRNFMDIPSVLSEPGTVYTRCWAWLLEETKLYKAERQEKNSF
jgi:hypothetical protein